MFTKVTPHVEDEIAQAEISFCFQFLCVSSMHLPHTNSPQSWHTKLPDYLVQSSGLNSKWKHFYFTEYPQAETGAKDSILSYNKMAQSHWFQRRCVSSCQKKMWLSIINENAEQYSVNLLISDRSLVCNLNENFLNVMLVYLKPIFFWLQKFSSII